MRQKVNSRSFSCTSTRVYSLGFRSRGSLGNQLSTSSVLPCSMQNGAINEAWFIPCVYVAWERRRVCNNQESNLQLCCKVSCFVNFVCLYSGITVVLLQGIGIMYTCVSCVACTSCDEPTSTSWAKKRGHWW